MGKSNQMGNNSSSEVVLRDVLPDDLPSFFHHQLDPVANHMAAFTSRDPSNLDAFYAHWDRIIADNSITIKTILFDGQVAGHVATFERFGDREVTYWIGRQYWKKGIAKEALKQVLILVKSRPLYARAAIDNIASIRVLEKCGFVKQGYEKVFANARDMAIEEVLLVLVNNY